MSSSFIKPYLAKVKQTRIPVIWKSNCIERTVDYGGNEDTECIIKTDVRVNQLIDQIELYIYTTGGDTKKNYWFFQGRWV